MLYIHMYSMKFLLSKDVVHALMNKRARPEENGVGPTVGVDDAHAVMIGVVGHVDTRQRRERTKGLVRQSRWVRG